MKSKDIIYLSLENVKNFSKPTKLCSISIGIGVFTAILIAIITGISQSVIENQLDSLGLSGITVYQSSVVNETLNDEYVDVLKNQFDFIEETMPIVVDYGSYYSANTSGTAVMWGVADNFKETFNITLIHGRLHNKTDIENMTKTVVVDNSFAMSNYKRTNIVGNEIVLNVLGFEETYTIIGVIESQKQSFETILGDNVPNFFYIPYTYMTYISGNDKLSQLVIKYNDDTENAAETIKRYLNLKLDDTISVENLSSYSDLITNISFSLSLILLLIGLVSVTVAAIGVCSTMYATVSQRKEEIGIYRALGASEADVLKIFTLEAVIISLKGSIAAIVLGFVVLTVLVMFLGLSFEINFVFTAVALLFSMVSAVMAAVFPAIKAAKLYPIDALRG